MRRELYVGSLPYETTEDDLRRLFSVAGTVQSVHLITDPVSGRSKGCGYVKMTTVSEAIEAINCLDGALIEGRKIAVSEAREQKPQKTQQRPGGNRPRRTGTGDGSRRRQ
ncbi:MAG TPA: RNA-binding protein [Geobacteraceae bacterium]|nr:RNA-binding protein [Geobacteraceae bacterium]